MAFIQSHTDLWISGESELNLPRIAVIGKLHDF
jgi:hypothetical protein